jgi:predicted ArsR family transcriptional regulator
MKVEDVFSSRVRMKILRILNRMGELNVSDIARRLGINYETTSQHLKILEDEGILQHKVFGRIRLFRFNDHSPKTKAIQNLIEIWEQTEKKTP